MRSGLSSEAVSPPFGRYSHGVEVADISRLVFCSGQLGFEADGSVSDDVGEQTKVCFANIARILEAARMNLDNVVRINAFVTDRAHIPAYMAVRDALFSDPPPASTLVIVSGFTRPEFKVEVEVTAAV
ncbi:RidA family protein [Hyphomicrobium sp. CS1GBMeth3]|uniref:RidA family protein n=1 Tax=Hyphomicrobium sp. CS1GBMeth3 TaxID=1892845 RepID=UPI00093111AB|nr:RidA family protein [Hyphomicrobium sp. CS1GBMeth3]